MIGERDLFGNDTTKAHARRGDPDTSHEAAEEVTPALRDLQALVLAYAVRRGASGFTDPEMNEDFGSHLSTYRTRRAELVGMGMVEDSGERLQVGGKGRKHAIWRVTAKGRAEHSRMSLAGLDQAA